MRRIVRILFLGLAFGLTWENGWFAPTEIQYATTPTSTWKRLAIAPAGDNVFHSAADNNSITRGRYYYFRMRHVLDNGTYTPWSKKVGGVWLTGFPPEDGTYLIGKGDNTAIIFLPGVK